MFRVSAPPKPQPADQADPPIQPHMRGDQGKYKA